MKNEYQNEFRFCGLPYNVDCQSYPDNIIPERPRLYRVKNRRYRDLLPGCGIQIPKRVRPLISWQPLELDVLGIPQDKQLWLYSDRCIPTASPENMEAYFTRLAHLANCKVYSFERKI